MGLCIGYKEMYELQLTKIHSLLTEGNLNDIEEAINLENTLFIISYSIQLFKTTEEVENVNTFLHMLFKSEINQYNIPIKRATMEIIHIISEFFKEMNDETIQTYIMYIVDGFNTQILLETAAQCFNNMILKNMNRFCSYLSQFLDNIPQFSQCITSYNNLWGKIFTSILQLSCAVYGNTPEEFRNCLVKIFSPFITVLREESVSAERAHLCFEYIADLFRIIYEKKKTYGLIKEPSREVLIEIFPNILNIIEKYSQDEKTVEASSRVTKHALRA